MWQDNIMKIKVAIGKCGRAFQKDLKNKSDRT